MLLENLRLVRVQKYARLVSVNTLTMTKRRSSDQKKEGKKLPKNTPKPNKSDKKKMCDGGKSPGTSSVQYLCTPTKSQNDKKEYRVLRLANGLTALLISDSPVVELCPEDASLQDDESVSESDVESTESDEEEEAATESGDDAGDEEEHTKKTQPEEKLAALSLCVGVGSFSDPWTIPGMAHFLEHMVFMGSEKYPKENHFDSYIKKRGGSDNASTECEFTTFYFECQEKHLSETMDRFSHFFISPLMKREAMTREREAIESEFQLSMPSHYNRKQQLLASLARDQSPAQKFSWGNLKTLRDDVSDDILYEAVHEFRRRHYSANRMTLAVQARLPLEMLEEWVCKYFSPVPNNKLSADDFSPYINNCFNTPEFSKIYHVDPVKDICQVELTWALPPMQKHYRSKPHNYVASVLGYEGSGSLLAYLRKKVWALDIYTGNDESGSEDNTMYSLFEVTLVLTEEGHKNLEKVLECVFGYINLMRKVCPCERIFNELKTIEDTSFRFAEEVPSSDNVELLAECMQLYPPQDYISGPKLFFKYDPQAIKEVLELLQPDNVNIVVATKNPTINFKYKEPWFGTRYTFNDIPSNWLSAWKNKEPDPYFTMPQPNIFLTKNFHLVKHPSNVPKYPVKIMDDKLMELWYRPDTKFELPMAYIYFYFISPLPLLCPLTSVLLDLYVSLLKQQMVETLYPAEEALLHTSAYASDKGLVLKIDGYNEKLPLLIETVMNHMTEFEKNLDQRLFDAMKEEQCKYYYNNFLKPRKLVKEIRFSVVMQVFWNGLDKYTAISQVTLDLMKRFARDFKKRLYIQCLIQGNISSSQAMDICNSVKSHLNCEPMLPSTLPKIRVCQLPLGQHFCQVQSFSEEDVNSVVTNYYQSGIGTIKDMCIVELLMLLMEEPLFNILRTKEQLGYHVFNLLRDTFGILGFSITVNCQADKHSTEHVDERIENFLKVFYNKLKKMSEKELDRSKQTAIKLKQCVDLHLKEEVSRNWDEITTGDYIFDRLEREIACIEKLTFFDLRKWMSNHTLHGTKSNFRKLSCQVIGHVEGNKSPSKASSTSTLTRISADSSNLRSERLEFSLELLTGKKCAQGEYITDIETFKQKLYVYPVNHIQT